ncbi:MAG: NADH-quinone oxidoreductase subunit NuoK [Chloroflexi bacterium]|nr:NADH-quinone oxidoreductase subunit NuoK [Chloroflexota bacterium]
MIPLENFLVLSAILFALGFYGVLARRSAILILIAVELMLAAVSINMVAFAAYLDPTRFTGIIFAIFVITVAAAEVGLALGIVLRLFRERASANVDEANSLKW